MGTMSLKNCYLYHLSLILLFFKSYNIKSGFNNLYTSCILDIFDSGFTFIKVLYMRDDYVTLTQNTDKSFAEINKSA